MRSALASVIMGMAPVLGKVKTMFEMDTSTLFFANRENPDEFFLNGSMLILC